VVLLRLGRFQDAEEQFDAVLRLEPANGKAAFNRGQSQLLLGRPEAAARSFEEALRLNPSAVGYKSLGQALLHLNRRGEAAQAFRAALRFDPADPEALAALAAAQGK